MAASTSMKALGLLAAAAAVQAKGFPAYENIPPTADLNDEAQFPNNSLYLRWRPRYHVLTPNGHMNDPCGPMYDPTRDEYHIFYQAFPQHVNFGNTSWGHATSKDLVTWVDVNGWQNRSFVAISPSPYSVPTYDWLGDFSGGAFSTNLNGEQDGNLTLMFTGDVLLPDNWQKPYELGPPATEQQAIATSSDGGKTWQKWEGNPWLNGQPGNWNVTGLRDPVFAPIPNLDVILGKSEPHWYLTLGSGIREVGPRIPLFSALQTDLTNWTFEGALWEPVINETWGGNILTGNYGANFELAGFYDEPERKKYGGDGETTHWIVSFGAEGYEDPYHPLAHWSLFVLGNVYRRDNGSAEFVTEASGVLDWGNSYALNTFYDSKNDRRVVWGWSDEDLNNTGLLAQGFQGSLNLPRELFILKKHDVLPPKGGVQKSGEIWRENADGRTFTVTTVAQHPLPDVVEAIQGNEAQCIGKPTTVCGTMDLSNVNSSHYHLQATISKMPSGGSAVPYGYGNQSSDAGNSTYVGLQLRKSAGLEEYTEIRYYPANTSIVLDRSHSSLIPEFIKSTFVGHFEPFSYLSEDNSTATENTVMDIFVDGSLLEIYINDRFALTSRIYPSRADALGAALIAHGGEAVFEDVRVWTSMMNVWPERPLNSSSPLVFDPYYETHITFPNPYLPVDTMLYAGN